MKALHVTLATTMLAVLLGVAGWPELTASGTLVPGQPEPAQARGDGPAKQGFEVWIADQSDTRPGYGGQILIYDPEQAEPFWAPAARLIGYTGTDRNDITRVRKYETSTERVPLYLARLIWLIEVCRETFGTFPKFPDWPGYEFDHAPDPQHENQP